MLSVRPREKGLQRLNVRVRTSNETAKVEASSGLSK